VRWTLGIEAAVCAVGVIIAEQYRLLNRRNSRTARGGEAEAPGAAR
jgi:hypothetical protein